MNRIDLHLLGTPEIERDGKPIVVDTRKAIALLAYLAVSGGRLTRDGLAGLLWPDYDQTNARAALRRTLSTLRKALGEETLVITRESVGFAPNLDVWCDAARFTELVKGCRGTDCTCLSDLREAAALYRGDFLAGFTLRDSTTFDDWQFFQTEGLRRMLAEALEKLAACLGKLGEFEEAILHARRWLSLDPLREDAHRQLMMLYAWKGERNAALRQYRECLAILERELGVEPLEETKALYRSIQENRVPTAPGRQAVPEMMPGVVAPREVRTRYAYPLVGRTAEWEILESVYRSISQDGFFLALEGEAGIGKTRLAEEFTAAMRLEGAHTLTMRCYEGQEHLAYGPIVEGLREGLADPECARKLRSVPVQQLSEAARLAPELSAFVPGVPDAPPLQSPGAQMRFYEGIRAVLVQACGGKPPGILLFDDLHWADEATIELVSHLVRRLRGHPILILGTWRSEAGARGDQLRRLAAEARRAGLGRHVTLERLELEDIQELVCTALPEGTDENLPKRLYEEAEGLPFFLTEYLTMVSGGGEATDQQWEMPGSVRDLLKSRLAAVSETASQVLSAASVIGRVFDFDTVSEAAGRSETETLAGLEELLELGLVVEQRRGEPGEPGLPPLIYDFSHEKLRELVYDETSLARRRLLHRRTANALAEQARGREAGALAGEIARHYHLAGEPQKAAVYYQAAGEYARKLYANTEALAHFQAALAAGHPDQAALHEAIGDLQTLTGEYASALESYRTVGNAAIDPARLHQKLGDLYRRLGDWERSEGHYRAALEALDESQPGGRRASVYADWGLTAHLRGDARSARYRVTQALEIATGAGDTASEAQAHNILGILARRRGDLREAAGHLRESLAMAEKLSDPGAQAAALNNLALVYGDLGETDRALKAAGRALEICRMQGDRHREAALLNNLADLYHAAGESEKAMEQLKRAVVLFAEIGMEAGGMPAEVWKLTEW